MEKEFITIGEASRLLKRADTAVMLLIKEALQGGVEKEEILKAEMRDGLMMYVVSRTFLLKEVEKEREGFSKEEQAENKENTPGQQQETGSLDLLSAKDAMIATLQKMLDTKDQQIEGLSGKIDQLIERDHETNILLKGLQDRLFLLEQKNPQGPPSQKKKRN